VEGGEEEEWRRGVAVPFATKMTENRKKKEKEKYINKKREKEEKRMERKGKEGGESRQRQ